MDNRRIPISVSVNPSEYAGKSIRLGNSDIREKMNQRMREFEEESRKWRDQFISSSSLTGGIHERPRMFVNFPEFPELSAGFGGSRLGAAAPLGGGVSAPGFFTGAPSISGGASAVSPFAAAQTSHKSFIEEDDHGNKKYKMTFEIGDFKPSEIQVRTEGRQLIVKGDRELIAGSATESKQFNREITLPDFVEPTSVVSFLSDGVLTLEAPVALDRLGYSASGAGSTVASPAAALNNSTTSSSSTSTSSTMRNSPFRDNSSNLLTSSSLLSSNIGGAAARNNVTSSSMSSSASSRNTAAAAANNSSGSVYTSGVDTASSGVVAGAAPLAQYKFNMSEFRPEDIAITVTDTTLKIHAMREETDMRGVGKTYREFKREIGLPHGADVKQLRNALQSDGTLTIEIPVQSDNTTLRPPLSPTGISKQFGNFSLNENSAASSNMHHSSASSANTAPPLPALSTSSLLSASSSNGGLIDQTNNGKELRLTFDLTGYKPEDLSIKVIDNNTLKVHAVHIDNTRGNQIHREYTRQYILPEWVQPELLRARMSDDGTLTVEVPLPQMQPSKYERLINITNSNR